MKLLAAARAEVDQRAAAPLQLVLGLDAEAVEHLAGHVPVLARVQPLGRSPAAIAQRVVDGGQLDDFRARAANQQQRQASPWRGDGAVHHRTPNDAHRLRKNPRIAVTFAR